MGKVGVALSGGGIASCAHIGVLKALEEHGIQIDAIAGTSSGGIVAALYGYGFSADELMALVPTMTRKVLDFDYKEFVCQLLHGHLTLPGLYKGEVLKQWVERKTQYADMCDLPLPVAVVAVDLKTGNKVICSSRPLTNPCPDAEVITEIPIALAVQASCSIPFLFKPVEFGNRVLVDGGIIDNCPVSALYAMGVERVIAVNMISVEQVDTPFPSCLSVLERAVFISLAHQIKHVAQEADLLLQPKARSIGIFDFDKSRFCLELGYECALEQMEGIKRTLHSNWINQ